MLEWERSVVRPPTRWTDDIKRVAGSRWIQAAQNRGIWNSLQRPMAGSGRLSVDMMMMKKESEKYYRCILNNSVTFY
ncbi:jg10144 [Pararge aegeria aegeria]|uniref:Jg10144 protein n=1 Tax=Pararge aegeria aegeria TaxID=348720 RepID=A0A8S4R7G7_9NEOP|nr:jg10144 [Pararge aegeria aegeria]